MRWLLLVLTVVSIWLTIDVLRWARGAKDMPFSAIAPLWRGGLQHLTLAERQKVLEGYRKSPILAVRMLPPLFAVISLALLLATAREFLH